MRKGDGAPPRCKRRGFRACIHYDLSFVKQQVKEPWYLIQKPYPGGENESTMTVDGVTFYVAGTDEVNSYYAFPGTCYNFMLERTKLLGDGIEDGFAPK
ncbi:MAG: hypothetical protein LKH04_04545 [Lachnospiraceae bacterium]|nr:hypothetical protein [Lachnospiraceae bacterium]MCI1397546.1 hypothetical protein [Lachnospiraceae bacterium]MCI1423556.1 hypothetical protein [Lachnospiraceae bacterium]MCI1452363.1 hypothetical protein [Lachnospiraceae bacterium]